MHYEMIIKTKIQDLFVVQTLLSGWLALSVARAAGLVVTKTPEAWQTNYLTPVVIDGRIFMTNSVIGCSNFSGSAIHEDLTYLVKTSSDWCGLQ